MEYNLQKKIENNLGYLFPKSYHLHITPYPNVDYVNPGVGCSARLHSIYVPIFSKNPYEIKKTDQEVLNMEGKGTEQTIDGARDESEALEDNKMEQENPESYNERKRKLLGDGVFDSFQSPKIKTIKTDLKTLQKNLPLNNEDSPKTTIKKSKLNSGHKFSVID